MVDGWIESKASLVIQNVILLFINAIGVWRWYPKAEKEAKSSELSHLVAKPIAAQKRLVDCNRSLRAFRDGYHDQKNVARHVTGNIYAGDAGFLSIRVRHHATFRITLAAETLGKIGRLMAAGREEQASPGQIRTALEYDLCELPVCAFQGFNRLRA